MRGFLWMGSLMMWIGILTIFGGTFFAMSDSIYQCVTGYGCDDVWKTAARLFGQPQVEMADSVDSIIQKTEDGTISKLELDAYRKNIIAAFLTTLILFVVFTWLFTKMMTTLSGTDYMVAMLFAIMTIAIIQLVVGYFVYGDVRMPFIGFIKLFEHPEVMVGAINYSELLPMNQTLPEG